MAASADWREQKLVTMVHMTKYLWPELDGHRTMQTSRMQVNLATGTIVTQCCHRKIAGYGRSRSERATSDGMNHRALAVLSGSSVAADCNELIHYDLDATLTLFASRWPSLPRLGGMLPQSWPSRRLP